MRHANPRGLRLFVCTLAVRAAFHRVLLLLLPFMLPALAALLWFACISKHHQREKVRQAQPKDTLTLCNTSSAHAYPHIPLPYRKSVVKGTSVTVRVSHVVSRNFKKKQ